MLSKAGLTLYDVPPRICLQLSRVSPLLCLPEISLAGTANLSEFASHN